jgi:hypothetical protein
MARTPGSRSPRSCVASRGHWREVRGARSTTGRARDVPPGITPEARAWIISLACQQPTDLGWAPEFWSEAWLARYVRGHAVAAGHPSTAHVRQGTISKLLVGQDLHPHRVPYDLPRRDPDGDRNTVQVLQGYQQVTPELDPADGRPTVRGSSEDKPGIPALAPVAPDRPPQPEGRARGHGMTRIAGSGR